MSTPSHSEIPKDRARMRNHVRQSTPFHCTYELVQQAKERMQHLDDGPVPFIAAAKYVEMLGKISEAERRQFLGEFPIDADT